MTWKSQDRHSLERGGECDNPACWRGHDTFLEYHLCSTLLYDGEGVLEVEVEEAVLDDGVVLGLDGEVELDDGVVMGEVGLDDEVGLDGDEVALVQAEV